MADKIRTRPGTNRGPVDIDEAYFHDNADGSYDLSGGAHAYGWDVTSGAWVKLPVDHGSGALKMYVAGGSVTLAAGSALIGEVAASAETSTVFNGATALTPKFAPITASAPGATEVVAAVTSKKIRVLSYILIANGTVNTKFQSHVAPTDKTGLAYLVANSGVSVAFSPIGHFETVSGEALDINLSAGVAVGGHLTYVEV